MAACARMESSLPGLRSIGALPLSGIDGISHCCVDDNLGLVTPALGKKHFDVECSTTCPSTCSTSCLSSTDAAKSIGWFDDFERPESGNKVNSDLFSPSFGMFDGMKLFFAEDASSVGAEPWMDQAELSIEVPSTPHTLRMHARRHLSAPKASASAEKPPLLRALMLKSLKDVQAVLESSPVAACEPFWDENAEPPLCAAIRLMCGPRIVALLLDHGAEVEHVDVHGHTPLQILDSPMVRQKLDTSEEWSQIEQLLLDAGADVSLVGEMPDNPHPIAGEAALDWIPGLVSPLPNVGWYEDAPPLPADWVNDA